MNLKTGKTEYEHSKCACRPMTVTAQENVDRVHDSVMADRQLIIRRKAEITRVFCGIQNTLMD